MNRIISVIVIALAISGCQKLQDYYNYKDVDDAPPCRVASRSDTVDIFIFNKYYQYDALGKPVSVTYETQEPDIDYTEQYTFNYNYDQMGRLVSTTSDWVYGPDQVYYAYEGNSRLPVRDTLRPAFPNVFVEDFTYDDHGRIIKIVKRIIEQWDEDQSEYPDEVTQYYYDVRGNRQPHPSNAGYNGPILYDTGHTLLALHPVWQLEARNWSKNSPMGWIFNEKNLPVARKAGGVEVEYACEE